MPAKIYEGKDRSGFPFPPIEPIEPPSSPSDSSESRTKSSRSRSHRSSSSPAGGPHEHDRRHRDVTSSKLLSKLISREERDSKQLRTALVITSERLENETRRADEAERRIIEVLHRLRSAHEATMLAQAEAARSNEEVRLHKLRLEEAQREIYRAQEIVNTVEQEKAEAEAEAARARTTARKFREERLMSRAREEGKKQGFQEGLVRGREIAWQEERNAQRGYDRRQPSRFIFNDQPLEEDDEEEAEDEDEYERSNSPPVPIIHIRDPRAGPRRPLQPMQPMEQSWRPPSRSANSRASVRSPPHASDTAPHAAILPVPTLATPLNAPSPSHDLPPLEPASIPGSNAGPRRRDEDEPIHPIPIHNPFPSPFHPPVSIPPDNYIPYANSTDEILLPPPHELSRPVSPASSIHSLPPDTRAPPAVPVNDARDRNFGYHSGSAQFAPSNDGASASVPFSPQSKTSTQISDYDLLSKPSEARSSSHRSSAFERLMHAPRSLQTVVERATTPSKKRREDRYTTSPRGPRPMNDLAESEPSSPPPGEVVDTDRGSRSPLDRLFKKRFRSRTHSVVPDIDVVSPSTTNSSHATTNHTVSQPYLLTPDPESQRRHTPQDAQVTQGKPDSSSHESRSLPALPLGLHTPEVLPLQGELPPGFVPLTMTPVVAYAARIDHPRARTTSPRPKYEEAPIPEGVVYPYPPGKQIQNVPPIVQYPPSPAQTPSSPSRRPTPSADQLSPLNLFSNLS